MLQKAEGGGDFQHTQPIRAGLGAREKNREVIIDLNTFNFLVI